MNRRLIAIVTLCLAFALTAAAQQDPLFSHYWAMEPAYNPAAVGKQEKVNFAGAYQMNLTGFTRNPRTMYAGADMPFYMIGGYHGIGGQFFNDQIGLFSHNRINLQYAYKTKLFGGRLSIGVQAGMISENFDGSKVELNEGNDPAFSTSELTGTGFDLAAGLYYTHKNWYAGISSLHLTAPTIELGESNELALARAYYFTAGCNIRLHNPFITIHPSLFGVSDAVGYRADATCRVKYTNDSRVMWAGLGYSPSNSFTVMLGGLFHGVSLGYSYEVYTNGLSIGNGSHGLFVGYQTDLELFKKGRNRHQAVRIL